MIIQMKKILVFVVLAFAAIQNVNAQDSEDLRERLFFGLKIGANYANVYDSEGEGFDADPKLGFAAGAFLSIPIGSYLGIHPELLLSQRGFRATGVLLGSTYEFTRTTTYLDLPVLIALKPNSTLTLLVGPQYSYLIKRKDVFTNSANSVAQEDEFENDNIRKNILCFVAGGDLNFNNLVLGGRFGWDVTNNNGDGTTTTPRYKNVWLQASLGFRL